MIVVLSAYHLMLLSDMVPLDHTEFRDAVGISLISVISLTVFIFVFQIFLPLFLSLIYWVRKKYQKKKFYSSKKRNMERGAIAICV